MISRGTNNKQKRFYHYTHRLNNSVKLKYLAIHIYYDVKKHAPLDTFICFIAHLMLFKLYFIFIPLSILLPGKGLLPL